MNSRNNQKSIKLKRIYFFQVSAAALFKILAAATAADFVDNRNRFKAAAINKSTTHS